jgi:hypothetical protein
MKASTSKRGPRNPLQLAGLGDWAIYHGYLTENLEIEMRSCKVEKALYSAFFHTSRRTQRTAAQPNAMRYFRPPCYWALR